MREGRDGCRWEDASVSSGGCIRLSLLLRMRVSRELEGDVSPSGVLLRSWSIPHPLSLAHSLVCLQMEDEKKSVDRDRRAMQEEDERRKAREKARELKVEAQKKEEVEAEKKKEMEADVMQALQNEMLRNEKR